MAPRHHLNPAPQTESAKEAARSFFCELCQKGYSRQPELDAHLMSYDHTHRQRLKDTAAGMKDYDRLDRQRRRENAEAGLIKMDFSKPKSSTDSKPGEKKKGGFKPMTIKRQDESTHDEPPAQKPGFKRIGIDAPKPKTKFDLITYDLYDPAKPTECSDICHALKT